MPRSLVTSAIHVQVTPEQRTSRDWQYSQRTCRAVHKAAPSFIFLIPRSRQLRKVRPTVGTVCIEYAEECRYTLLGSVGIGTEPVVVISKLLSLLICCHLEVLNVLDWLEALEL